MVSLYSSLCTIIKSELPVCLSMCLPAELMRKCYMINTPFIFNAVWFVIKGLLAARYVLCVLCVRTVRTTSICTVLYTAPAPTLCGCVCLVFSGTEWLTILQGGAPTFLLACRRYLFFALSSHSVYLATSVPTGRWRRCRCGAPGTWTSCCRKSTSIACPVSVPPMCADAAPSA
jgi:hypothetical protein